MPPFRDTRGAWRGVGAEAARPGAGLLRVGWTVGASQAALFANRPCEHAGATREAFNKRLAAMAHDGLVVLENGGLLSLASSALAGSCRSRSSAATSPRGSSQRDRHRRSRARPLCDQMITWTMPRSRLAASVTSDQPIAPSKRPASRFRLASVEAEVSHVLRSPQRSATAVEWWKCAAPVSQPLRGDRTKPHALGGQIQRLHRLKGRARKDRLPPARRLHIQKPKSPRLTPLRMASARPSSVSSATVFWTASPQAMAARSVGFGGPVRRHRATGIVEHRAPVVRNHADDTEEECVDHFLLGWSALLYLFGALLMPWEAQTGLSKAQLSLGLAAAILASALMAPVAGRPIDAGCRLLLGALVWEHGGYALALPIAAMAATAGRWDLQHSPCCGAGRSANSVGNCPRRDQ